MRTILHCDLNNFYASVECLRHPEYRDVPVAVSGNPAKRHGIILAKNNLAKSFGVTTGEVIWHAKMKCPNLICLDPHYEDYVRFSEQVFSIYTEYTDRVEAFGADECWLDVTDSRALFGDGQTIADKIRAHVTRETGLTISVGVSWNKIFAKLGSDLKKPNATSVISQQNYLEVAHPLPVSDLFMVGHATAEQLKILNIQTIGDLSNADEHMLVRRFGINGSKLLRYARGEDDEPVRKYYMQRTPDSIGHGITAKRDLVTYEDFRVVAYFLSDMIAKRLRKAGYLAGHLSINLRDANLLHQSRQIALYYPTDDAATIAKRAFELIQDLYREGASTPIRTMTISTFDFCPLKTTIQHSFFHSIEHIDRNQRLGVALDKIGFRFGRDAVKRAITLGSDFVYDKTDCEDFLPFKR